MNDPVQYLQDQIASADRRLNELSRDFELIEKRALSLLLTKRSELDRWAARRRTLIEIWEYMTNKVWPTEKPRRPMMAQYRR